MNSKLRLPAVVVAISILVAACGQETPPPRTGGSRPVRLPSTPTELPQFDLPRFEELLGQLQGQVVVVNVWGSWCGPCIEEAPVLADVSSEYLGKVQFIGVDILDQLAPAREFIRKYGWPYPSVFDPPGHIRDGLGFVGQPVTAIYDRSGQSILVWSGAISTARLTEEIEKVL